MPLLITVIELIKDSTVIKAYLAVELISPPSLPRLLHGLTETTS